MDFSNEIFKLGPPEYHKNVSPCKAPSKWKCPEDFPVFAFSMFAVPGQLRKQWYKWLTMSERKKQAIRDITLKFCKLDISLCDDKME